MIDNVKNFFKAHGHLVIWFYVLNVISGFTLIASERYNDQNGFRNRITLFLLVTVAVGIRRAYKLSDVSLGILYGAVGIIFLGQAIFYRSGWQNLYGILGLALWFVPPFLEMLHKKKPDQPDFDDELLNQMAGDALKWKDYEKAVQDKQEPRTVQRSIKKKSP